jgi:chromate transport protein ChrA
VIVSGIVPAIVAIAGALLYAMSSNAKLAELGRLAYLAAVIALCFAVANQHIRIG